MNPDSDSSGLPAVELKRAWRIVSRAGLLGSIYYILCINGAPRIKFLTELGATPFDFGLIAGLAAFVLVFQIFGSIIATRLRRRKPLWITLAVLHRLLFLGVLLAPMLFEGGRARIWWIIGALLLHDAFAQLGAPLWMSWMADLVPRESLNRHWAARQRFITISNVAAMLLVAVGFHYFEQTGQIVSGFIIFASAGVVLGVVDILMFMAIPEPPLERVEDVRWLEVISQPLRDRQFRPFLYFMGYWHFAAFFAAPFFGLYMIDSLGLSVLTVQIFGAGAVLGVALASRFWGLVCDTYGYRPVFQVLTIAKIITPTAFLIAPRDPQICIPYLGVVLFVDGIMNAGFFLSIHGYLLKSTPKRNRAMYIAAASFLSVGVMAGIAPILSGQLIESLSPVLNFEWGFFIFTGFHAAFALSAVLRIVAFYLASRIQEPGSVPLPTALRQCCTFDSIVVTRMVYQLQESEEEDRRLRATEILGDLRHPMAIGELINALKDSSPAVRKAAAEALGKIGQAEAAEALSRALFDSDSGIQSQAARALGQIGGTDSLQALLANLRNLDSAALAASIDSLAEIGHDAALVPLICLFDETDDPEIHDRIVAALTQLAQPSSAEEIFVLLRSRRPLGPQRLVVRN